MTTMTSPASSRPSRVRRNALIVLAVAAALQLIPAIAMRFTSEVNWTGSDFVAAFVVLSFFGLAYVFISSRIQLAVHRWALGAGLFLLLAAVWVEMATGFVSRHFAAQ